VDGCAHAAFRGEDCGDVSCAPNGRIRKQKRTFEVATDYWDHAGTKRGGRHRVWKLWLVADATIEVIGTAIDDLKRKSVIRKRSYDAVGDGRNRAGALVTMVRNGEAMLNGCIYLAICYKARNRCMAKSAAVCCLS
jgi:hypothetical protein